MTDLRNIADIYKNWSLDLIKQDVKTKTLPFSIMMSQIQGDFNFSSVVRSANFFGAKEVYYYGKRKWDKRGAVGTYIYTAVNHLESIEEIVKLKEQYKFIALENNIEKTVSIDYFNWPDNSLIILGEEGKGLTPEILDLCDYFVEIPGSGSVRSINASVAGSIAMYDYVHKYKFERTKVS